MSSKKNRITLANMRDVIEANASQEAHALELAAQANMAEVASENPAAVELPAVLVDGVVVIGETIAEGTSMPGDVVEVEAVEETVPALHHVTDYGIPGLRIYRNGVKPPVAGSKNRAAWDLCDMLTVPSTAIEGAWNIPARKECIAAAKPLDLSEGNVGTEYYGWARYNGFRAPRVAGRR